MPEQAPGFIETDQGRFVLNVRPSLPDINEWQYRFAIPDGLRVGDIQDLTAKSWWTQQIHKAWNQGSEGSCTGHAQGKGHQIALGAQGLPIFEPSPRFIYNVSRIRMGTLNQDSGATIMDSIMGEVENGVCTRAEMPYTAGAGLTLTPTAAQYQAALAHQVVKWENVSQADQFIGAALEMGNAVSIGFVVYSNFNPDGNGYIPMPQGQQMGGHNVLIIRRNAISRRYGIFNSWDESWGIDSGKAWMDFNYILNPNLCFEMKVVNLVEGTPTPPPPPPPDPIPPEQDYWTYLKTGFRSGMEWYGDIKAPPGVG